MLHSMSCMHACMYVCAAALMAKDYGHVCMYVCMHMPAYMHACVCIYLYTHFLLFSKALWACMYVCMYACLCVCYAHISWVFWARIYGMMGKRISKILMVGSFQGRSTITCLIAGGIDRLIRSLTS
jgi:hypothetical protein